MAKFKARDYLNSHDDPDAWQEVEAFDEAEAAETYLEAVFPYEESQGPFQVEVMNARGATSKWSVDVDYEPTFSAGPLKEININGRKKSLTRCIMTYKDLVWLAYPGADPENELYTITYFHPTIEGTVKRDGSIELLDGMVINIADTSSA